MPHKRKLLFITGTRADYGKLKPLMLEVERSEEFECHIFATGMHMLSRYGTTVNEIHHNGFRNVFPYMNQNAAAESRMDLALASTIQGIAYYIREHSPDMIVVHGDRIETLAGAVVGALSNVLVAHFEGGELSGTIDDLIRHAVTKLSHLHFVANEEFANRLIQMGESAQSIFVVGSPDIDIMLSDNLPPLADVRRRYDIRFEQYSILIYHPVTTELDSTAKSAAMVVDAALGSGRNFVVIYPNNDQGSEDILRAYERIRNRPNFHLMPSMRFEYFLALLRNADLILGNSSAGIREAPVYGVPTINIGSRQANRFQHSSIRNLGECADEIRRALVHPPPRTASRKFGAGDSARRFMHVLRTEQLWQTSPQKHFCDLVPGATAIEAPVILALPGVHATFHNGGSVDTAPCR